MDDHQIKELLSELAKSHADIAALMEMNILLQGRISCAHESMRVCTTRGDA